MSRMELVKRNASYKGYAALGSIALTTMLFINAWWFMALFGAGASAFLTYRWFSYRAKWGMRF